MGRGRPHLSSATVDPLSGGAHRPLLPGGLKGRGFSYLLRGKDLVKHGSGPRSDGPANPLSAPWTTHPPRGGTEHAPPSAPPRLDPTGRRRLPAALPTPGHRVGPL